MLFMFTYNGFTIIFNEFINVLKSVFIPNK